MIKANQESNLFAAILFSMHFQKQREKSKDRKSQKLQLKSSKSEGLGS